MARSAGLEESSCATMRVCTMLITSVMLGEGGRGRVTPKMLSELLMRDRVDEPSPLERMCARALGLAEEELTKDTGLTDFIKSEQQQKKQAAFDFVPPPGFYARFAVLLEQAYGPYTAAAG